jgi:acyl-CoA synthetase (AMP-forming)/AMP-acid ligase II
LFVPKLTRIGGKNVYPLEIEERLTAHSKISLASVIGIADQKYGEVVGAFIQITPGQTRPSDDGAGSVRPVKSRKYPSSFFFFSFCFMHRNDFFGPRGA